ncbi:S8 family serine peptidase [Hamadaea sp. NPDC051192]|uniref:S8 family peptidase n=1 Tax=Hamadaea sp. NPDC051192 TaxID=3154940 RepID=UPI003419DBEF
MILQPLMWRRLAALASTIPLGLGVVAVAADSTAGALLPAAVLESAGAGTGTVTLVTGDRVELLGPGRQPRITPAAGRKSMPFQVRAKAGHLQVIPGDAAGLIAAGRLDERLFDVTTLLASGYDDSRRAEVPVIVQSKDEQPVSAFGAQGRVLRSIGATAVSVPKRGATAWWKTTATAPGVRKVWLNGLRRVSLDRSAAQINAPVAWGQGLTGAGVTVAVVDSGIDASHPDLAGKVVASANFTADPAGDGRGHGTHVASTIAGTGAASNGRYRGIAPDARLLDAKVCDAEGMCAEDAILAGMEWAVVTQHARVVNMSLGGVDTPDVDPLEQAVNSLSAQYGTLFVVAAGNSGPSDGTVESPGSAEAALTVGAVDRSDAVAEFSSRGPVRGTGGLKPDLAAPGVDIVAALAAGTEPGEVVDDRYVRLSGTSMATPHVAGAAAILLQAHPQWTGGQLKSTLMGSAHLTPDAQVADQGAGRVDVAAALKLPVTAAPASVGFGVARWPHTDDPLLSTTITYTNTGDGAITLALDLRVTGADGVPAPAGSFTVGSDHIVVPAHGSTSVTVTADTKSDVLPVGRYAGRLLASADGVQVSTPVGVEKESEHYDLKIRHIGRDGAVPGSYVTFVDRIGDCGADPACGAIAFGAEGASAGVSVLRLPPGRYTVAEFSTTAGTADTNLLMRPVLDLTRDVSLTVDARRAKAVELTAPRASARLMQWDLHAARDMGRPGAVFDYSVYGDTSTPLYTADLGGPPASGDLLAFVQGRLAEPGPAGDFTGSPYEYQLAYTKLDRLFTGLRLRPAQRQFAAVQAQYAAVTSAPRDVKTDHGARPTVGRADLLQFGPVFATNRLIATAPFTRTEYYLADGVAWNTMMMQGSRETGATDYMLYDEQWHRYEPGRTYRQAWASGVFGPHFAPPQMRPNGLTTGVMRRGDQFGASVSMFADSDPDHAAEVKMQASRARVRLYRDGALLEDWRPFAYLSLALPPQESAYRLEATMTPLVSEISTSVTTAWTFRSAHVDGDQAVALPLLGVRYRPDLDAYNRAAAGAYTVPVEVFRQPGAGTPDITQITVEYSVDDGGTWRSAPLTRDGSRWLAAVDNPAGGAVSLRITAADADGNRIEQTTTRAYLVR